MKIAEIVGHRVRVSHSYLSQVKNGKRPASAKVISKVSKSID